MARIAVLGCGRIGRIMPTLLPPIRAQPAGVFNVHRPFMEAIAGHHDVPAFASAQDAFASGCINCIINDAPEVGFEHGRQALILAEAAYRFMAEGRIVKVSEIG